MAPQSRRLARGDGYHAAAGDRRSCPEKWLRRSGFHGHSSGPVTPSLGRLATLCALGEVHAAEEGLEAGVLT